MNEEDVTTELTVEDILGAAKGSGYHTLLEIWLKILLPARTERHRKMLPQWANRIVGSYNGIGFTDLPRYKEQYYDLIEELLQILEASIEEDDQALNQQSAEEDLERNGPRYLQVLIDWQRAMLLHELEWDVEDQDAAVQIAVLSEVHKMFFAQEGLITLLDRVGFEITDDDRERLAAELEEMRATVEGL